MHKSELTSACYNHKIDEVERLIASGAAVDASDNGLWHGDSEGCIDGAPYYTPLGEAARSDYGSVDVQLRILEALLDAGAPVDQLNYRGETAFHFACQLGRAETIRFLAEAGADVHLVGCLGNGVNALVNSYAPDEPGGRKVEAMRAVLALGVDPRTPDPWGRDLVDDTNDYTGNLTSRSRSAKARGRAVLELMELVGEAHPGWEKLEAWLEAHRAAYLQGDAKARKAAEKLAKLRAAVGSKGFEKKVARAIGKSPADRYDDLARLTKGVLCAPEVVADPSWADLVRTLLALTVDYGDLTEDIYGQRLSIDEMDEDEGGSLDMYGDERLSTVEHCLVACRAPGASAREDYVELVREICETKHARIGTMSFGDDEAAALVKQLRDQQHPAADELAAVARRSFPFASFG